MELFRYNATAVFAGPSNPYAEHTASNIKQLYGIQSASFDFAESLHDIESSEGNVERLRVVPPSVNLSLGYYVRNGWNEGVVGFVLANTGGAFQNFIYDERNYFVTLRNNRLDALLYSGYDNSVVGFGQGCLTSYGVQASVGAPLTANVSFSFLNVGFTGSSYNVQLPTVNKQNGQLISSSGLDNWFFTGSGDETTVGLILDDYSRLFSGSGDNSTGSWTADTFSFLFTGLGDATNGESINASYTVPFVISDPSSIAALGQGDITMSIPNSAAFGNVTTGVGQCLVQSFELQAALPRQEDRPINYFFPRTRQLDVPLEVRLTVEAYVNGYQAGFLNNNACNNSGISIQIDVNNRCINAGILHYKLNGARLDSTSFSEAIGDMQRVTMNWSAHILNMVQTGITSPNLLMWTGSA